MASVLPLKSDEVREIDLEDVPTLCEDEVATFSGPAPSKRPTIVTLSNAVLEDNLRESKIAFACAFLEHIGFRGSTLDAYQTIVQKHECGVLDLGILHSSHHALPPPSPHPTTYHNTLLATTATHWSTFPFRPLGL